MNTPIGGRFVVPEVVATHFHLKEGDVVADLGAGKGFFLKALSNGVGTSGKVYACEIQKQLVDNLGEIARSQNLSNIYPIWCDLEEEGGVKIADNELDVALLINTLFLIEDKPVMAKEIIRITRSGGRVLIVDWTESFSGLGPHPDQVFGLQLATDLFEEHGLVFETEFPAGDHHYGLAFRKP